MKTKYFHKPISVAWLKLFGILLSSLFCSNIHAQIYYSYDADGNRTQLSISAPIRPPVMSHRKDNNKNDSSSGPGVAIQHGITVYPNPASEQVNVSISSLQSCEYALIYLQDASGNLLLTQKATSFPVPISLTSYKQGMFYIRIVLCGEDVYYKVIKASPGSGNPSSSKPPIQR